MVNLGAICEPQCTYHVTFHCSPAAQAACQKKEHWIRQTRNQQVPLEDTQNVAIDNQSEQKEPHLEITIEDTEMIHAKFEMDDERLDHAKQYIDQEVG